MRNRLSLGISPFWLLSCFPLPEDPEMFSFRNNIRHWSFFKIRVVTCFLENSARHFPHPFHIDSGYQHGTQMCRAEATEWGCNVKGIKGSICWCWRNRARASTSKWAPGKSEHYCCDVTITQILCLPLLELPLEAMCWVLQESLSYFMILVPCCSNALPSIVFLVKTLCDLRLLFSQPHCLQENGDIIDSLLAKVR